MRVLKYEGKGVWYKMELAEKIRTDARLIAKSLLEIAVERGDMREALRVHRKKYSEFLGFENAGKRGLFRYMPAIFGRQDPYAI